MSALQHSSRFGEKEAPKKEGTIGTAMVDLSRYGTGPVEYGTRKSPVWKDPYPSLAHGVGVCAARRGWGSLRLSLGSTPREIGE